LRGLLTFRLVEGEAGGMSTFGLLYPSMTLAEVGDPLNVARRLGGDKQIVEQGEYLRTSTVKKFTMIVEHLRPTE